MLADDDEPVRMRVGECFWGIDKTAAEEKLEALTDEAQQHYRQLEQQMAGGCSLWNLVLWCLVVRRLCTCMKSVCLCGDAAAEADS